MSHPVSLADSVQLFYGEATPTAAHVYARMAAESPPGVELAGHIEGPFCDEVRTLPFRVNFAAQPTEGGALAAAIVPDPSFWTPELPMLYRAQLELRAGGQALAAEELTFGIRPFGAAGPRLRFDGRTWVLRGVDGSTAPDASVSDFREAGAALWIADPDEALCAEASRIGVPLVAEIPRTSGPVDQLARHLRRLGRWPAVMCFVFHPDDERAAALKHEARNVLFAALHREGDSTSQSSPAQNWADAFVFEATTTAELNRLAAGCSKPAIALRRLARTMDAGSARNGCDQLQAELAAEARGRREWAGYIV